MKPKSVIEKFDFCPYDGLITVKNYQNIEANNYEMPANKVEILQEVSDYDPFYHQVKIVYDTFGANGHDQKKQHLDAVDYELTQYDLKTFFEINPKRKIKI